MWRWWNSYDMVFLLSWHLEFFLIEKLNSWLILYLTAAFFIHVLCALFPLTLIRIYLSIKWLTAHFFNHITVLVLSNFSLGISVILTHTISLHFHQYCIIFMYIILNKTCKILCYWYYMISVFIMIYSVAVCLKEILVSSSWRWWDNSVEMCRG